MIKDTKIKEFYDSIQFPGPYTKESLSYYDYKIQNPYISIIYNYIPPCSKVLDIGCGTGLISNLMALKNPTCQITGVDFADSINYAQWFAVDTNIKNVDFEQSNILDYRPNKKFDVIICQGVLHHIPDWQNCIDIIKHLLESNGTLLLGVYHPWGKIVKKIININYKNYILYKDQELNPFETTFTQNDIRKLFPEFKVSCGYPSWAASIRSLFNYQNGGLVLYVLRRKFND